MMEMEKDKLRDKINSNEYLLYKLAERYPDRFEAPYLSEHALMAAKDNLYKDMLRWMPFNYDHIFNLNNEDNPAALPEIEERARKAFINPNKRVEYFDPEAFVITMEEALANYSPDKGTLFTSWFSYLYNQRVLEQLPEIAAIANQQFKNVQSRTVRKTLKNISDYLTKSGLSFNSLSDEALEQIADRYGWTKEKLLNAWRIRETLKTSSLNAPLNDADDETTLGDIVQDETSFIESLTSTKLSDLVDILEIIETADSKEYTKLFWSNLFLHPLKDTLKGQELKHAIPQDNLLELYRNLEPGLIRIFDKLYVSFCLEPPLTIMTIDAISKCRSLHPFIDKTISLYKDVKPAYVSQEHAKFRKLQEELRKMYVSGKS